MLKGMAVNLRAIKEDDLEWLREGRNKYSRDFFTKDIITPQQQRAWYQKYTESVTDKMFIVEMKNGHKVGTIAIYNINQADRTAEVGRTLLLEEFRGLGYMEEAIKLLKDHAFKVMNLWHLRLSVYLDNAAAISLYHRCGFESTSRPIMLMEAVNPDSDPNKPMHMNDFED